ncbi:MAG TPA: 2-phosphosulfolactate phosphatase, partial [Solirubrobacteraceae bacterium]|nr:2-phosphosulfolactate phosphatase [Solirubrobacteraceae bacterium]
ATWALAAGYERVLLTDTVERALTLRGPGRVLAGERGCVRPPQFDQGNSPAEAAERRGRELVLATTNGTPAVVAATGVAPTVLLGSLLNLDALIEELLARDEHVLIVCAGTDGQPALEDVYVAGRIAAALYGPRSDCALMAQAVARAHRSPLAAFAPSANAVRLRSVGLGQDVCDCARESVLDVVAEARLAETGIAVAQALTGPAVASASWLGATDTVVA